MIYPSKFRKAHRLKKYDYSSANSYFLTFDVKNKKPILSEIIQPIEFQPPIVNLFLFGQIVEKYILRIPIVYPGVTVDNYVIMPDHVHLLLTIERDSDKKYEIASIIRSTKGAITKEIGYSIWQLDYYDVIADTEAMFLRYDEYIDNNPAVWFERKEEPPFPKI